MLNIGNKTFMTLQEAVGWLLENNALPFQSTANYVGNTEIAMSTLINPSPAKVRVGSIIFFADSKVSTVVGVTSNSFIVSDQYNDLVDDVVYVSNVAIDASGHLICTLSNGDTIDAGQIKQISSLSINGSQHLVASYNDGTAEDLGAIFTGNVSISGTLTANSISSPSIKETMTGYTYTDSTDPAVETIYAGIVKNGNKLTMVVFAKVTAPSPSVSNLDLGNFGIPQEVNDELHQTELGGYDSLDLRQVACFSSLFQSVSCALRLQKGGGGNPKLYLTMSTVPMTSSTVYLVRYEGTFLLSENLAS